MYIKEEIRLAPYSKKIPCILPFPGSSHSLQVESAHVLLLDKFGQEVARYDLSLKPPLKDISTHLDIERERIVVQGSDSSGAFRKSFTLEEGKLLVDQKAPIKKGEKLTFGCHKKQEIEKLLLKAAVSSCLPHLFALGARAPVPKLLSKEALEFAQLVEQGRKEKVVFSMKQILEQRCVGIFHPSSKASKAYGIGETSAELWAELYPSIRSLFIRIEEQTIAFLPMPPTEFHAGKMTEISLGENGTVHFIWSKKRLFKVLLSIEKPCSYRIETRGDEKKYRLRFGMRGEAKIVQVKETLQFTKPGLYFLDRWER